MSDTGIDMTTLDRQHAQSERSRVFAYIERAAVNGLPTFQQIANACSVDRTRAGNLCRQWCREKMEKLLGDAATKNIERGFKFCMAWGRIKLYLMGA